MAAKAARYSQGTRVLPFTSLQWLWRKVIMGIKENDKFEFERRHNYERISTSNR